MATIDCCESSVKAKRYATPEPQTRRKDMGLGKWQSNFPHLESLGSGKAYESPCPAQYSSRV